MHVITAILLSLCVGVVCVLLNICVWFVSARRDADPTTGGAYVALAMITTPVVFVSSTAAGFVLFYF